MSKEIDRIREAEQRRQLLFIPVSIVALLIGVGLYALQFTESIRIGEFYLWGVSKYIWTLCVALFGGLSISAVATLISRATILWRVRNITGVKIKVSVAILQIFKCLLFVVFAFSSGLMVSYLILEKISEINSFLTIDSVLMEMIAFFGWMFSISFILGALGFFVIGAIKAPFEYIKNNQIKIDYSANDGAANN